MKLQIYGKQVTGCSLPTTRGNISNREINKLLVSKLSALFRLLRPETLFLPCLGVLSGAAAASAFECHKFQITVFSFFMSNGTIILLGVIMAGLLNAASNVLNQLTEIEIDRINKPNRILVLGLVSFQTGILICVILYLISLTIAWFIQPESGFRGAFYFTLIASFITVAYSVRPFYLKSRTWIANASIAITRGLLLTLVGWSCISATIATPSPWVIGGVFFLFFFGAASTKDFADLKGDREHGCNTLVVRYGPIKTVHLITPFLIVPWLFLSLAAYLQLSGYNFLYLNGSLMFMTIFPFFLSIYGIAIALMMINATRKNLDNFKISWKHMYILVCVAHIGITTIYLT